MPIAKLAILAPGLLGGSVARAAHERKLTQRTVLWARRPEVREALAVQPWCESVTETAEEAVSGAELVVVAASTDAIVPIIEKIAPHLSRRAVVTDVGSVKNVIARAAHDAVKGRGHFVGAHPMAGSEKTGWENSVANLFVDRVCFVTPLSDTDSRSHRIAATFWQDLGARVVNVDPEIHDEIVAHISHLPQLIASSLCSFLADKNPAWRDYAGGGLRDTTRIAGSDPALWRAILEANQAEVLGALQGFQAELSAIQQAMERRDWGAVTAQLARGKRYRDGIR
jgi:cyclohexadieny/prephenate dehydrogenase